MPPAHRTDPPACLATAGVLAAQVTLGCEELDPLLAFFVPQLGFRLQTIFPADDPASAVIEGHGLRLRLERGAARGPETIELLCTDPAQVGQGRTEFTAPNGTVVRLVPAEPAIEQPEARPELVVARADGDAHWVAGRAGLRYRDLLPGRWGGAFIASHIRVLEGGPVPDYVHFHEVRFQTIFCRKGWVRVVYEDQGEPFVMQAGDCVLQPPRIRHRVLESSAGAEVVEVSTPAEHLTRVDHGLPLPTPQLRPGRDFSGQRFVRHIAAQAPWLAWRAPGLEMQDTGIGEATRGLAGVRVLRPAGAVQPVRQQHAAEFCFYFVLDGRVEVQVGDAIHRLAADDSIAIPGGAAYAIGGFDASLRLLEVTLPAAPR